MARSRAGFRAPSERFWTVFGCSEALAGTPGSPWATLGLPCNTQFRAHGAPVAHDVSRVSAQGIPGAPPEPILHHVGLFSEPFPGSGAWFLVIFQGIS